MATAWDLLSSSTAGDVWNGYLAVHFFFSTSRVSPSSMMVSSWFSFQLRDSVLKAHSLQP